MRKLSALLLVIIAAFSVSSCDKAAKLLFQPFESPLNFTITIPAISNTDGEMSFGSQSVSFNLDEEVKANTDGKLDGDVVGAIYINEVAIQLTNSNETNNLSNFDYVTLSVSSGSASPVVFGPFVIQPGATSQAVYAISNSPNVKPFFNGDAVNFELRGHATSATTIPLNAQISATLKFDK